VNDQRGAWGGVAPEHPHCGLPGSGRRAWRQVVHGVLEGCQQPQASGLGSAKREAKRCGGGRRLSGITCAFPGAISATSRTKGPASAIGP